MKSSEGSAAEVEAPIDMKIVLSWQRRAVVILAGSLIILSIILAVFAIREADRERLLREKEIGEEQRRSAATVADQAKSLISDGEQRITMLLESQKGSEDPDKLIAASKTIVESEELVSEVFFVDEGGIVSFPYVRPLFLLSGEERRAKEISGDLEKYELWRRAENAEFRTKNYSGAIDSYQRLMAEVSDPGLKGLILSRLGRSFVKLGDLPRSIDAYKKVLDICPPDLTVEGIPLAALAWFQIIDMSLDAGKMEESAEILLEFRRGILQSRWPLTRSQFEYYAKTIEERFETATGEIDDMQRLNDYRIEWDELDRLQVAQLSRIAILEDIGSKIIPRLGAKQNDPEGPLGKFFHIFDSSSGGPLLVSYTWLNEKAALGLILNPEVLAQKLLPPDPRKILLREGWHLQVADDSGNTVSGEDISSMASSLPRLSFAGGFEENFPPWKINIYQTDLDSALRQFHMRRAIYIFSVFVVIAALFFGGFLAIRGTAKELKLAKLKSDFVSTVSHEFRTPLMSIRYLAELLQRGRVPDERRKQEYYETITGESERLGRLVENILDFSKIETGLKEYRKKETNISALAAEVASQFRRQAAFKDFKLETEIAENVPKIAVDKEAISRALFNLLDNAVKYSGENPQVFMRIRPDADHIIIEIEDNGIGISRNDQQRIFDKFYRSEQALEGNVKGSGIGLTLVDHIVKAHEGKVLLESDPGKGTTVTIQLPLGPHKKTEGDEDG